MFDGRLIRKIRKEKDINQLDIYMKSKIRPDHLSRIENNQIPNVGIDTLSRIAGAIGCEVADFMAKE